MKLILTDSKHLVTKHIYKTEYLNVWIKNYYEKDVINIKYNNDNIEMYSNNKYKIVESDLRKDISVDKTIININQKYYIHDIEENKMLELFVLEDIDENYKRFKIINGTEQITISGKYYVDSDIVINGRDFEYSQIFLKKNIDHYEIETKELKHNIYVENNINTSNKIKFGECIFINGIILCLINNIVIICYDQNSITYSKLALEPISIENIDYKSYILENDNIENSLINFKRVPKIQRKIEKKEFQIDGPGSQELKESMPVIYTMLPMLLMSMTSLVTIANTINAITLGEKTFEESLGALIVSGCMIIAMILYPIISNSYRKKRESKREIKRIEEYKDYIYEKKRAIHTEMDFQKQILCDNYYNTIEAKDIIENINNKLWERKRGNDEFLTISLGTGNKKPNIDVRVPEEHFTIDRDKLRIQIEKLEEEIKYIKDVPITFDFEKNNVVSFIGNNDVIQKYLDSFLIRIFSTCSYDDVKLVLLTNKTNKSFWNKYIDLPYLWNVDKSLRFFGYDPSSYSRIVNYLDEEYRNRETLINENPDKKLSFTNYIIIIDDINKIKNIPVLNDIIKNQKNYGFTIIFNTTKMDLLPSDCKNFIYINKDNGKLISNIDMNYIEEDFKPDVLDEDYTECYKNLSNINIDSFEKKFILPNKYGFLEMYNAGSINSLDITGKWNNNSIVDSISVPIGIDDSGELVKLNVHENSHGPHGLVAGMTGSGKSELLITYILSLAVNYSPEEVQFVLIDYKGGGLANTFYNSNIGMILPHVVGVITNINENEINRSLISLQSEIKRRQKLFAEASIKYNEGNMDIYKYETLYKNHNEIERLSHLFIISDEFAELKTQNPEFINQLISIARIGRSLGVHLILSTQKPSGVVDDQIWSNSRFKICLKVQDKTDSNDMIKVPDAAMLKESGRFYLQVGYNELFIKGQSAYSGVEYIEKEDNNQNKDEKIDFINEYGKKYFSIDSKEEQIKYGDGKEINNIVKYIIELSKEQNYNIKGLWRELIPDKIYYDELIQKYKYDKTNEITALIGEYDAPELQKKDLATINIIGSGNTIIYGVISSGKEMLLQSMIYSLISKYSSDDINIYIMDLGSETLMPFRNAPQVGDVMYINDKEKIYNTFKLLNSIIEDRKKKLIDYNGDLLLYNENNENKLPVIILTINILETLFETYEDLTNEFIQISRESNRYGISFVVTTNGINNVRNKMLQGFKQSIALELKDKYDYTNIFGNKVNTKPTKYKGRGYINVGNTYEFQTAYISKEYTNVEAIEKKCNELSELYNKVRPIPVLPEIVSYDIISKYLNNNTRLPIGIDVEDLSIKNFVMTSKRGVIVSGVDIEVLLNFSNSLEKNITSFKNNKLYIFNTCKKYKIKDSSVNIINDEHEVYLKQLKEFAESKNSDINFNYIFFVGIYDLYNALNITFKKEFNEILKQLNNKDNFSLIFIDSSTNIKKLEFEDFYRNNVNNNRGIWIGNGITEQMILKCGRMPREYRETVTNKFGYVIENGIIRKVKLLDYYGGEDEQ